MGRIDEVLNARGLPNRLLEVMDQLDLLMLIDNLFDDGELEELTIEDLVQILAPIEEPDEFFLSNTLTDKDTFVEEMQERILNSGGHNRSSQ